MAVYEVTVGIDEVGRGALAGPVVVVAAMVRSDVLRGAPSSLGTLKDSKKLSAKQREAWCTYFIRRPNIVFAVARVYPRQIEKRNISSAANLAASRAFNKLLMPATNRSKTKIFLDGGLYIGNKKWQAANLPSARTLPKADETIPAVAIASIIAKVHRDRFMKKLAKRYPNYGLDVHKGYGTKIHRDAITMHGPSAIHRLTFIKKALII